MVSTLSWPSRDHPRVCGEHRQIAGFCSRSLGSSPRMRGTQFVVLLVISGNPIIPAYAGNTRHQADRKARSGDHPRVCGEHVEYKVEGATSQGSSPRMRGTPECIVNGAHGAGIIPAYAGNTQIATCTASWPWDHPRVCGEHRAAPLNPFVIWGSSPRMRGTRVVKFRKTVDFGIIPAYAGNTDYIREHVKPHAGSSPRMRGTLSVGRAIGSGFGIIPAYAGNTLTAPYAYIECRDHPRVCGEHWRCE